MTTRRNGTQLFPNRMGRQNLVQRVYKAHYRGRPQSEIAERLGVPAGTVCTWLADPAWYYPWIDWVVLDRALSGDRGAFDVMTAWERSAFLDLIAELRMREIHKDPDTTMSHVGSALLTQLSERLDIPMLQKSVQQKIQRIKRRKAAA